MCEKEKRAASEKTGKSGGLALSMTEVNSGARADADL